MDKEHATSRRLEGDDAAAPGTLHASPSTKQAASLGPQLASTVAYILGKLKSSGLRRYEDDCAAEIVRGHHRTHAWRGVCSITDFVRRTCTKEEAREHWRALIQVGAFESTVRYLRTCTDPEFPEVIVDRHIHAFPNGLLDVEQLSFTRFEDPIPPSVVACAYHNMPFDSMAPDTTTLSVMATPQLDLLLSTQINAVAEEGADRDGSEAAAALNCFYALLGRLLFAVGEKDSWKVLLAITGRSASLKTTIANLAQAFFGKDNCPSMIPPRGFSLQDAADVRLLWRAQIDEDFELPAADLLAMVGGERPLLLARKGEAQASVKWRAPGIVEGSALPNAWMDEAVIDRLVVARFDAAAPEDFDVTALLAELPRIMYKTAMAYLRMVREVGARRSLWSARVRIVDGALVAVPNMPRYFARAHTYLREACNPLRSFLAHGPLHLGTQLGMPFAIFRRLLAAHTAAMPSFGAPKPKRARWDDEALVELLLEHGITQTLLTVDTRYDGDGQFCRAGERWLRGVQSREPSCEHYHRAQHAEDVTH